MTIRAREQALQDRFDGLGICEYAAIAGAAASVIGGVMSSQAAGDAAATQSAATDKAIGVQQQNLAQTRSDLAPYKTAGDQALARLKTLLGLDPNPQNEYLTSASPTATYNDLMAQYNKQHLIDHGMTLDQSVANGSTSPEAYAKIQAQLQKQAADIANPPAVNPDEGSLLRNFSSADLAADPIYGPSKDFAVSQGEKAINARRASNGSWDSGAALKELGTFDTGVNEQYGNDAFNRFTTGQNNQFSRLNSLVNTGQNSAAMTGTAGANSANNVSNLISGQGNASAAAGIAGSNAIGSGLTGAYNNYQNANLLSQLTGPGARSQGNPPPTGALDNLN